MIELLRQWARYFIAKATKDRKGRSFEDLRPSIKAICYAFYNDDGVSDDSSISDIAELSTKVDGVDIEISWYSGGRQRGLSIGGSGAVMEGWERNWIYGAAKGWHAVKQKKILESIGASK